jgi:soluble lytic murein transglycosylase-like protein
LLGRVPVLGSAAVTGPGRAYARSVAVAAIIFALACPALARAELYSWVDEEGVIHLTNVRPDGPGPYKPYEADDAEGFGGQKPLVLLEPSGEKRVLYAVDVTRYDALIKEAADHYQLPFAFIKAVMKVESNFNPRAQSHADAKGLMQMIDATAMDMNVNDPWDPRQSVFGGTRYLRVLANMFDGNMALTAAAYNAGPERVLKTKTVPNIRETQQYVRRVLTMYRHYRRTE